MRNFVLSAALASCLVVTATTAVLWHKYRIASELGPDARQGQVVRLQHAKISESPPPVDTIILGDSTAGTGVDANLLSELLRSRTLNLALTGSFGLGGALALLQRIPPDMGVQNVVFLFSIDLMASGALHDGFIFAGGSPLELRLSINDAIILLRRYFYRYTDLSAAVEHVMRGMSVLKLPPDLVASDYPLSFQRIQRQHINYRPPTAVSRGSFVYLGEISRLCQLRKLNCLYIHGAILDEYIDASVEYLDLANTAIDRSGIRVLNSRPIGFSFAQRGDTVFHVHPSERRWLTARYFELLENALLRGKREHFGIH